MRPGAQAPAAYAPRVFVLEMRQPGVLDRLTLLGASASADQCLRGDIGEVLVFGRVLRFDELMGLDQYLRDKWGLGK